MTSLKALQPAISGTYVVEEWSQGIFDLVRAGVKDPPGALGERDTARAGGRTKAKRGADSVVVKYTRLPALDSIDPLLAKSSTGFNRNSRGSQTARAALTLPAVAAPSDDAFREWLKLPALVSKNVKDEKLRSGSTWSLLLLRATFDDDSELTVADVGDWLSEVLDMSLQDATACATASKGRPVTFLKQYADHKEASEKASDLHTLGLAVQVVSSAGIPMAPIAEAQGDDSLRKRPRAKRTKKSYEELFGEMKHRPAVAARPRAPQQRKHLLAHGESSEGQQRKMWRGEAGFMDISVVPKDPVRELLFEELASASDMHWRKAKLAKRKLENLKLKHKGNPSPTITEEDGQMDLRKSDGGRVALNHWDNLVGPVTGGTTKLNNLRKEVCQMMRFFIFGAAGVEHFKTIAEKEAMFLERIGSREQIQNLFNIWTKLDADGSGRVNFQEFRDFSEDHVAKVVKEHLESNEKVVQFKAIPEWAKFRSQEDATKFTNKLNTALEKALLGLKSSFVIEDLMRFIWPAAQIVDLIEMRRWCVEMSKTFVRMRVEPPPVMPKADLDGLMAVFKQFDTDGSGELQVDEMLATGLIYEDQAQNWVKMYGKRGKGSLNVWEFSEMMCPTGFRAYSEARTGSLPDGTQLVFDRVMECWKQRNDDSDDSSEEEDAGSAAPPPAAGYPGRSRERVGSAAPPSAPPSAGGWRSKQGAGSAILPPSRGHLE